jgi:hypothetical protein
LKPVNAVLPPFGVVKLVDVRSVARASSRDKCSNTYRPLVVVSSIDVVLVVLTRPFTRKATTATIRMQATVRATAISTKVIPCAGFLMRTTSSSRRDLSGREIMKWRSPS